MLWTETQKDGQTDNGHFYNPLPLRDEQTVGSGLVSEHGLVYEGKGEKD